MANNKTQDQGIYVFQFKAERIVSGLQESFCPDVMAHVKKASPDDIHMPPKYNHLKNEFTYENTYNVYVQAYLPRLEYDFQSPLINILPELTQVDTEISSKLGNEDTFARQIQIVYVSHFDDRAPYSLWSFFAQYCVDEGNSVPLVKIALRDTDPTTSRGTVTTVENSDPIVVQAL